MCSIHRVLLLANRRGLYKNCVAPYRIGTATQRGLLAHKKLISNKPLYSGCLSVSDTKTVDGSITYVSRNLIPLIRIVNGLPGITTAGSDKADLHFNGSGEMTELYIDILARGRSLEPGST